MDYLALAVQLAKHQREAWEDGDTDDPPAKRYLIAGYPQAHCMVLEGAQDRPPRVYLLGSPLWQPFMLNLAGQRRLASLLLQDALGVPRMASELLPAFMERTVAHWDFRQGVSITAATIRDIAADLRAGGEYADPFENNHEDPHYPACDEGQDD